VEGPSQAQINRVDNDDGSADVTYLPLVAGEYAVHVVCDGEDIVGSPFMVDVQRPPATDFDPTKVCLPVQYSTVQYSTRVRVGWSKTAIFSDFGHYFFRTFGDKSKVIIW